MTTYTERTVTANVFTACSHDTSSYTARPSVTKAFPTDGPVVITEDTPPIISNVHANSVGTDSVEIDWNTDEAANCRVYYSTYTYEYGWTHTTGPLHAHFVYNGRAYSITGLTPETDYYFYVESADMYGNSGQSAAYHFKTAGPGKYAEPPAEVEV